jgi:allantoicase
MERNFNLEPAVFANLVDVAQERLGGKVLFASDEFFAPKESLIKPGRSDFSPATFNETGQVYDGWETRRKGGRHGMDFAIVEL